MSTPLTKIKIPYFYAVGAFFCMALFAIATREAFFYANPFSVSFLTYFFGALGIGGIVALKQGPSLQSERKKLLIGRGLFGVLASLLYTLSIQYIPLVNSTLFFNTAPLFIPVLLLLWHQEKVSLRTWASIIIGFFGVALIVGPHMNSLSQSGNLLGLFSGLSLAIAYFFMKLLTRTEPTFRIIFYYLWVGALVQVPAAWYYLDVYSNKVYFLTIAAALMLLLGQIALITAFKTESASKVSVFQYLTVVFVGLIDWFFWGNIISPQEIVGILMVIGGVLILHK